MRSLLGMALISLVVWSCAGKDSRYADDMEKEHAGDKPVQGAAREPKVAVSGEKVSYGKSMTGYLAYPEGAEGPFPALIVIHEWWGLNENIEMTTRRFWSLSSR